MLNMNALQTHLINKTHLTLITVHSDKTKTVKLLLVQYYWLSLLNDCSIFIVNCWTCCWMHILWDKISDLLHSLLIEDKCWQHVSFNFKTFSLNKKEHLCSCWSLWEESILTIMQENSYSSSDCLIILWVHLKNLWSIWDSYIRLRFSIYISIYR